MDVRIERERLDSAVAASLIATLNVELTARYPEEGATHFRLDPNEVADGRGAFLVAYVEERAVGCGAVRLLDDGVEAEIKRMYVDLSTRGRGIGRAILVRLEEEARAIGARRLVLETGVRQPEAMGLYASCGFAEIPRFGEYVDSPLSVCMAKELGS